MTAPVRTPILFVNERSGGGAAARAGLVGKARGRGIKVVVLDPGQSLATLVDRAIAGGADALGMAGGDGSLGVVAAAAAAHDLPFVCVAAGTRNHFARDLGVDPHDVAGALDAFSDGLERRIDLGDVNGRVFVNNVSLGLYGEAVSHSAYRDAKARTLVETAAKVLGPSGRTPAIRLVDDTGREHTQLAVVLVSNNPYALKGPDHGTRPALDTGSLGILVLDAPGGRPPPGRAWTAPDFEISAPEPVPAGIDGEAVTLSAPLLRFTLRPSALRVRISSRHRAASLRSATPGHGRTASK
jgi:diacylglycerol kinase family enzyme